MESIAEEPKKVPRKIVNQKKKVIIKEDVKDIEDTLVEPKKIKKVESSEEIPKRKARFEKGSEEAKLWSQKMREAKLKKAELKNKEEKITH